MDKKTVPANGVFVLYTVMFRALIPLTLLIMTALASCMGTSTGDSVFLEFAPGSNPANGDDIAGFDAEGSIVLRCASIVQDENGMVISTSKSMNMKANTLLFVPPAGTGSSDTGVRIASAPISGEEYEYDMTRATFYTITTSSVSEVLDNYGIPFLDWQTGAYSNSERFPCCE